MVCSPDPSPGALRLGSIRFGIWAAACPRVRIRPHLGAQERTSEARLKFVRASKRKATIEMDVDRCQFRMAKPERIAEDKQDFSSVKDINNSRMY